MITFQLKELSLVSPIDLKLKAEKILQFYLVSSYKPYFLIAFLVDQTKGQYLIN